MKLTCPYCNQLTRAVKGDNFCSKVGDDIFTAKSNAFHFNSNHLHSGEHISRLTIRSINRGYQYHKVGNREIMLDADKYLVVNEGDSFRSEVRTTKPVEGLIVAFSQDQTHRIGFYVNSSHEQLLDNPFRKSNAAEFYPQTFHQTKEIQSILNTIKKSIVTSGFAEGFIDEQFYQLLLLMVNENQSLHTKIDLIKVKKKSTQLELYKRLNVGKEYIDAHLEESISLKKLSRISMMSPFHLLRTFKAFYGLTPHQYTNTKRLQKAKFLLEDTELPIHRIADKVGFEQVRSFRRIFKQSFRVSPKEFRLSL